MTLPRPHDQPISTHATADEALETFTVGLPQWPIFVLLSRNPLVRASDRIQVLAAALAVLVLLLSVPVAAAVGTAVHESRRELYAEQAHSRHLISATITEDAGVQTISRANTAMMQARWSVAGAEHSGAVEAPSTTKSGDTVAIWVDRNGEMADEPTPTYRAAVDAVMVALLVLAAVTAAVAILLAATRAVCDRIRAVSWQHDLDTLAGGGHSTSQP
jgi:hypothetical protein